MLPPHKGILTYGSLPIRAAQFIDKEILMRINDNIEIDEMIFLQLTRDLLGKVLCKK